MPKAITTIPARQFARDLAGAKRAADTGPVLITDRGRPAYALLRVDDYYVSVWARHLESVLPIEDDRVH